MQNIRWDEVQITVTYVSYRHVRIRKILVLKNLEISKQRNQARPACRAERMIMMMMIIPSTCSIYRLDRMNFDTALSSDHVMRVLSKEHTSMLDSKITAVVAH